MNWKMISASTAIAGITLLATGCNSSTPAAVPDTFQPATARTMAAKPPAHFDFRICVGSTGVYGIEHGNGPGKFEFVDNDPSCALKYRGGS